MIEEIFDLVIVGGGPAGMMAAGVASKRGLRVILLEKNDMLGKKLLITGGGRCNITNAEFDDRAFLSNLGNEGKFLFSTFSKFNVKSTFDFFESRGLSLMVEDRKRAFPIDQKSASVLNVLLKEIKDIVVKTNISIAGFTLEENKITGIELTSGEIIHGKNILIATGGTSHPETGSTGDAYTWLTKIGHTINEPEPTLVPIAIKDEWVKKLSGLSLDNVKVTLLQKNEIGDQKILSKKGRILFTHFGLSGPTILNMSREIGDGLKYGKIFLTLDLFSDLDHGKLHSKIQQAFEENKNKLFKNCLTTILPVGLSSLVEIVSEKSKIELSKQVNSVTRDERMSLIETLKNIEVEVESLLGVEKAIVTRGGVLCTEVDFKTMSSLIYPNLYFAGDILDITRPSGGFSLQICWTTGFVAGNSIKSIS